MHSFGRHKIKHKVTKFKMGSRDLAACDLQASHYSRTVNGAQTNRYQSPVCSGGSRTGDLGGGICEMPDRVLLAMYDSVI